MSIKAIENVGPQLHCADAVESVEIIDSIVVKPTYLSVGTTRGERQVGEPVEWTKENARVKLRNKNLWKDGHSLKIRRLSLQRLDHEKYGKSQIL